MSSSVAPSSSPPSSSASAIATISTASTSASAAHTSAPSSSSPGDTHAFPAATTPQPSSSPAAAADHSSPPSSGEHKFTNGSNGSSGTAAGSKGKRVFVFQKRWLHSLPIMEKTLPESVDVKKKSNANEAGASPSSSSPTGSSTVNNSGELSRDVIACMLCDEPGSTSHHLTRVWSRMNCRRGRIENHLMSKHPEFMLLLKHKRDTEGDLSVQLFLQGMRDGRCNIRSEINLGLYNHIQSLNAHANAEVSTAALASLTSGGISTSMSANSSISTDAAIAVASAADLAHLQQSAKRGFPGANVYTIRDGGFTTNNGNEKLLSVFPPLGGAAKTALEFLELENRHKRARLESAPPSESSLPVSSGATSALKEQNASLSSGSAGESATQNEFPVSAGVPALEASVFTQWHSVFYNKLVVVTGGENEFITSLATNLWLLGANVLLTFTNTTALNEFMTSHAARFPDADTSSAAAATGAATANHRGVMLSMLCAFHTRRQIDEWSKSVADKFSRVDFLINFVDEEDEKKKRGLTAAASAAVAQDQQLDPQQSEQPHQGEDSGLSGDYLVSSANRLLELCQSISKLCFQSSGAGSIINITTQSDGVRRSMNCAAVESMTKSLALELQPLNVQVNCILLQQISSATTTATDVTEPDQQQQPQQQDQQNAALSHTILFLLSPASASVSGSVLRLQHRATSAQPQPPAEAAGGANAPSSAEPVAIQTADSTSAATVSSDPEARASATQVEEQVLI